MREVMVYLRAFALFAAGIVVGTILIPRTAAQNTPTGGAIRLGHVGIAVSDFQASMNFYTKVMGYKVAYALPSPDGKPTTTFLQMSKDTFLEVAPANERTPVGITHIGIVTDDGNTTLVQLRQGGATVPDFRTSAATGAHITNLKDPDGINLELMELPAGSLMHKAMDSWK